MRRRRHRFGAIAAAVLLAASCGGDGVVGPGGARFARTGSAGIIDPLVGSWRRAVFFVDDFGVARSSETTWRFASDGSVTRTVVTRNLTVGLADVSLSSGSWRPEGGTVVIDLVTPSVVQLQFTVRVVGDQLELSGQPFLRVTS